MSAFVSEDNSNNVLVLFSGGIDSTVCVHYYKGLGYNVYGLFIDYGQKSSLKERESVTDLSKYFSIKTTLVSAKTSFTSNSGEILGRNYFLLSMAIMNLPFSNGIVSMGVHSETIYEDCTSSFLKINQTIYDLYCQGSVIIDCPLLRMTKLEIINRFLQMQIPLESTYSCEIGEEQPCGRCPSCIDIQNFYESTYK